MEIDVYNDATNEYDQTVSIDGTVISSLSTGKEFKAYRQRYFN
jgi:hypothetical protein